MLDFQQHAPKVENPYSARALVADGFDALSLDVFGWGNYGQACGVYDEAGVWQQLYNGSVADDPAYAKGASDWVAAFYKGLARRLLLIINFSSEPGAEPTCASCLPSSLAWNASRTLFLGNHSDGALSESGFTDFGSNVTTGVAWENRLQHMRHLQAHGKFYADVSYWGPLNVQTKRPAPVTVAAIEYIVASWLLGNEGRAAVYMGPNDCAPPFMGPGGCAFEGWRGSQLNYSQFAANVGTPLARAAKREVGAAAGCWTRTFARALAVVNPQAGAACYIVLQWSAWRYTDMQGKEVQGPSIRVPAASARVLLRTARLGSGGAEDEAWAG